MAVNVVVFLVVVFFMIVFVVVIFVVILIVVVIIILIILGKKFPFRTIQNHGGRHKQSKILPLMHYQSPSVLLSCHLSRCHSPGQDPSLQMASSTG